MLITNNHWERIRDKFSEEEKSQLRKSVTGEIICPAGITIDETKLNVVLEFKIINLVLEAKKCH